MPDSIDTTVNQDSVTLPIPGSIQRIMTRIMDNGGQVYIVGGAVRSIILNLPVKDWDLSTSLKPEIVESIFCDMPTVLTGKKFGTITVKSDNIPVEITTFRQEESYTDFRHPDSVVFVPEIHKDLSRRDFTINAMAYNPYLNVPYVDPFDGSGDLTKGIIRTVGNPQKRFYEDPLRVIRCVRFFAELEFTVDKQTYDALCQFAPLLTQISRERIREEFCLILLSSRVSDALLLLFKTGILKVIFPELSFAFEGNASSICKAVSTCRPDLILRLAAISYHLKHSLNIIENFLKGLHFDNSTTKKVLKVIAYSNLPWITEPENIKYNLRKLLCNVGSEDSFRILDFSLAYVESCNTSECLTASPVQTDEAHCSLALARIEEYRTSLKEVMHDPVRLSDLAINGYDLLSERIVANPGRELGVVLKQALDWVHYNPALNKKELLLAKLRKIQL